MPLKPFKAGHYFLLIAALSIVACLASVSVPLVALNATQLTESTPTLQKTAVAKTIAPTFTPTIEATPTAQPQLSAEPDELEGLEISFWHPWGEGTSEETRWIVDEFNHSNEWGIRVNVTPYYSAGALFDAVQEDLELEPQDLPQVIAAPDDQLSVWASEDNLIFPLDDFLSDSTLGLSAEEINAYFSGSLEQTQKDGHQIGLPALRSANVLFYNQTWAKELGFLAYPKTPAEFREQACAAAVSNNTGRILERYGTGGWLIDTDPLTTLSWLDAFGAQALPAEEGQEYTFNTPEGQAALAYLRGMLNDGCAWLQRLQTPDDFFTRRMALFYTGSLQDVPFQAHISKANESEDEWILIPYPREDSTGVIYSNGYSLALVVQAGTEVPGQEEIAGWLFLRWLARPENLARLAVQLPSLPVSSLVEENLKGRKSDFPWDNVLQFSELARPAPSKSSWRAVRRMVEDAGWQIYHLPDDQLSSILPELDQSIQEIK